MAENKAELEKPAGNEPQKTSDPTIHVIPAEFYGAVSKKQSISASEREAIAKSTAGKADGQSPDGQGSSAQEPAKAKKSGKKLGVVVAVVIVLVLGGGAAAYFLLFAGDEQPPTPSGPTCGNSVCESGESYMACPVDCLPPEPVCGDGACDENETPEACPVDCQVEAAVCGDGECSDAETMDSCPSDCRPPEPVCGDGECDAVSEDHETCPDDCRPPAPVAGPDLDSDGLTDREEREIYGTDVGGTDTDNDSYIDLNETLNLFDPARKVPAMLADSPGIVIYENVDMGYSLFRPAAWSVSEHSGGKTVFTAQEGEYVEVNIEPKDIERTLMDWYLGMNPDLRSSDVTVLMSKSDHEVIQSRDKLTSYVDAGDRVIVMRYDLGRDRMMQYRSTFFMMVQSLSVTKSKVSEAVMEEVKAANGSDVGEDAVMEESEANGAVMEEDSVADSGSMAEEDEAAEESAAPPAPVIVGGSGTTTANPPQTP